MLRELKKKEAALDAVHTSLLRTLNPEAVGWDMERAGEAAMDEMWSFVGNKGNLCWLWHAIDHHTGAVLADVFGRRQDAVFRKLKALLEPFGLTHYSDFSVVLFRLHFMLVSEEHPMKTHKNQWLLNLLSLPDIRCGATNQVTHYGIWGADAFAVT